MTSPLRAVRRVLAERRVDRLVAEMMGHTHGCDFDECPYWVALCKVHDEALDRARALS